MSNSASIVVQIVSIGIQLILIIAGGIKFFSGINRRLDRIEYEYRPNSGLSMRDAINRIEVNLSKLEGKFEQHIDESS